MLGNCGEVLRGAILLWQGLELGDSEVEDLDPIIVGQEQIFRLQNAMDNVTIVSGAQSLGDLKAVSGSLANWDASFTEALPQSFPFEQFLDDVGCRSLEADIIDCNNVGMIQSRGCSGFLFETTEMIRIVIRRGSNQLEGNIASESFVVGTKDFSHRPCTDLFEHTIVPDQPPDHSRS